jgi:hypothetical protein
MMRNQNIYAATIFAALASLTLLTACFDNSDASQPTDTYMNFVGTYYGESGETFIIDEDGSQSSVVAHMYAQNPDIRGGRRVTPAQGVWEQVGENEIRGMNIRFWTEPFGDNFSPNGLIMKAKFSMVFDEPVEGSPQTFTLKDVSAEYFTADQNPLTDDPIYVSPLGEQKAWRLEVEETR